MINELNKKDTLENIYRDLESGMPENKSIKEYALPNARQWLGGRFVAIWVLPIYFIRKFAKFSSSSAFVKPYSPSENGPSYKQPETLFTSLRNVFKGEDHLRFFDHRFIGIWVLPIALTGIVFEVFSGKKEIARGGRYDDLLKSLGAKKNIPAVGAAINLKNI